LQRDNSPDDLKTWATELEEKINRIARVLEDAQAIDEQLKSNAVQQAKIDDASLTPSDKELASMKTHNEGFTPFSLRHSQLHDENYRNH
ncbi:glutamate--cysteine ligase, partial [Pseudomonas syringae pv. tagetis]